ncbi:MAG: FAD-binding oxidoreductase [Bacteroidota bacterium]|nr:FAD-binding oxidoreductase [Bacteroidota bacterium]MDX5429519.1 FAD-binding oxidoreductase [Bacteroidota bacterium]MDX5468304.1 FAD-binding oxidoreductase [Bacteroidota bacterium]
MSDFLTGEVLEITPLSDIVRQFKISYALSDAFVPGQFVMLDLPIEGEFSTRSYSIASAPNTEGWIELCIVHKPGGLGTTYLFNQVEVGDRITLSAPQGKFVLQEEHQGIVMVATGTGVAPFRSMIRSMINLPEFNTLPIYLIFGNRFEKDILYRDEWEILEQSRENFHFVPVLSRESDWEGPKGYVHDHYLPIAQAHPNFHFYLCGWTTMVREAKNKLKERGFSRKQLKFELYD